MRVAKEFTFDSAHFLKEYHGQCERLHGHTYRLRVTVEGPVQANGLVMDFAELKRIVQEKVLKKADHTLLNDFLEQASVENLCLWVWRQLEADIPQLAEIRIWETPTSFAIYDGKN